MRILFISLLCLLFVTTRAQESIEIGREYGMHSPTLNEQRPYWVYLPPEYNNPDYAQASYPVIYLTDAEMYFKIAVAIHEKLTQGMYNNMPECIIVGIPNTNRTRDLTPTQSALIRNGKSLFAQSGGASQFEEFLTHELRDTINSRYRTNGYNILIGHSFGGLFTLYMFCHHPETFQAYLALDPSLWWDNELLLRQTQQMDPSPVYDHKQLFVGMARLEADNTDNAAHGKAIDAYCNQVIPAQLLRNHIGFQWKYYPDENHGTVIWPSMFDGLRALFDGIELPVKEIPDNPNLIESTYQQLYERLGFRFLPSEIMLDNIGKYALSLHKIKAAEQIFQLNLKYYPTSTNAQKSIQLIHK